MVPAQNTDCEPVKVITQPFLTHKIKPKQMGFKIFLDGLWLLYLIHSFHIEKYMHTHFSYIAKNDYDNYNTSQFTLTVFAHISTAAKGLASFSFAF